MLGKMPGSVWQVAGVIVFDAEHLPISTAADQAVEVAHSARSPNTAVEIGTPRRRSPPRRP